VTSKYGGTENIKPLIPKSFKTGRHGLLYPTAQENIHGIELLDMEHSGKVVRASNFLGVFLHTFLGNNGKGIFHP